MMSFQSLLIWLHCVSELSIALVVVFNLVLVGFSSAILHIEGFLVCNDTSIDANCNN